MSQRQLSPLFCFLLALVFILFLSACEEEFDLYAPQQRIVAIYSVLDPGADTQYVRVSDVFQFEGDVVRYAENFDGSIPNLVLTLIGEEQRYQAQWRDSILKDTSRGDFGAYTSAYYFLTQGREALQAGKSYRLEIRFPDDSSSLIWGETMIPPQPRMTSPRLRIQDDEECLPVIDIEDDVFFFFQPNPDGVEGNAYAFQARLNFRYRVNGMIKQYTFGPSRSFVSSSGCEGPSGQTLCYRIGDGRVFRALQRQLEKEDGQLTYDFNPRCTARFTGFLSDAIEMEITALDVALGRYIESNSPFFRSLNAVPPEFTNLQGSPRAVGVLGSLSKASVDVTLSPCVDYDLGWSGLIEDPCE